MALVAGYVHGKHPEMCPLKCKPVLGAVNGETKKQTLIREALEYQVRRHFSPPALRSTVINVLLLVHPDHAHDMS